MNDAADPGEGHRLAGPSRPLAPSILSAEQRALLRMRRGMGARLVLLLATLAAALGLEAAGRGFSDDAQVGLYGTIVVALGLSILYGAIFAHVRASPSRMRAVSRFAWLQLLGDIAVVASLVHHTGGSDSVFVPLYVLVVVHAATLFGRTGAYAAAACAALAFGLVMAGERAGWLVRFEGGSQPPGVELAQWAVHACALLVVALLASVLSRELQRTGEDLDRSRSELHRVRRLHDRTVESLLSGLLTTDERGIVTSFNPEAEHITGLAARDAIGTSIDEVLPGARERVMAPGDSRSRMRMPFENRLGAKLHLGLAGSVLREADGSPAGRVVIFQDVTRVVQMERELTRSERLAAVGQLSAAIAHEIRNPLAAISGSIQMLRGDPAGGSDESRRLMEIVLRETDRLNTLITDFLQYARPGPTRREHVRLAECVEELVKMLEPVRPPNVSLAAEIDPSLAALADPAQMRQLLWNLCLNAVQAMPDGGRLVISATAVGTEPSQAGEGESRQGGEGEGTAKVEITVRDTGVGIPPDVVDRIFDPFFTTKREGSGLGLATVHRIVEGHGGSLRVESAAGVGTAFRVLLPRAGDRS